MAGSQGPGLSLCRNEASCLHQPQVHMFACPSHICLAVNIRDTGSSRATAIDSSHLALIREATTPFHERNDYRYLEIKLWRAENQKNRETMTESLPGLRKACKEMNQRENLGRGPEQLGRQESENPVFFPPPKKSSPLLLGTLKKDVGQDGGRKRAGLG